MKENYNYNTVSEALNDLIKRGYLTDFSMHPKQDCLVCNTTGISLSPDEFEIDETHRFEGNTDPGDEMIVFAISSKNHNMKGTVVNAYGIYSHSRITKIVERLKKQTSSN